MFLKFLGKGSAMNPALGNTSAYFTLGKCLYLIDCGWSVFERLIEAEDLSRYDIMVLLTHLHADHVGSLGTLIAYQNKLQKKEIALYHPEESLVELLGLMGVRPKDYDHISGKELNHEAFSLKAVEVPHTDTMTCYGFFLEVEGKQIFYSGDSSTVPECGLTALMEGQIDELYLDIASRESDSHCSIAEAEGLIPPEFRNKVYAMHFDGDYKDELQSLGFRTVTTVSE